MFCNGVGGPVDGWYLVRGHFYPLLDRADLPRVRFHDLRHSAATFLTSLDVALPIVSSILGHSSIKVTADV